jgi:tRNA(Arg) A34 adenosine deaminase TadA
MGIVGAAKKSRSVSGISAWVSQNVLVVGLPPFPWMDLDMSALDTAWQATYELAWEAWRAGTVPIGAVVTDPAGMVIARGRNRIFDPARPPGQLAGAWIAHAEVNALLQLPAVHYEDFAVTSTTEPCLMCAGAITMFPPRSSSYSVRR